MIRSLAVPFRVLVVVLGAAAGVLALPGAPPAGAVANGEVVAEGSYRFAARLTMTPVPELGPLFATVCSGALVAPAWIVTAGHCFVDAAGRRVGGAVPYPTSAVVGTTDAWAPVWGRRRPVDVVEVHQAPDTDLALVRLARPVPDVAPIALATAPPELGATLRLAGWGATGPFPLPSSRLRTGLVAVTSVTGTTVGVTGRYPAPDTSACLYDSGAPYFTDGPEPRLVAVENDGPPCPHALEETAARVDTAAPWIRARLRSR